MILLVMDVPTTLHCCDTGDLVKEDISPGVLFLSTGQFVKTDSFFMKNGFPLDSSWHTVLLGEYYVL